MIKAFIPKPIKLVVRLCLNRFQETFNHDIVYAKPQSDMLNYTHKTALKQRLRPNDAKVHNLQIAIASIEAVQIMPNEVFSFWKIVGNPSKRRDFTESRSIVGNKIEKSVGGGLCQLSGLIYYISLKTGLEIIERHNHSIDIYTEETRFTPLGSDATVAYGYKDLKIKNSLNHPIRFSFVMEEEYLSIFLHHSDQIAPKQVSFQHRVIHETRVEVDTLVDHEFLVRSSYQKPK